MRPDDSEHPQQSWRDDADLLAGVLTTAMDAIIVIDDAEQIVLFNHSAETMFGCSASDAIGSSIERFIPERFREAHSTHVRRFGDTGVTTRAMGGLDTLWGLRADGQEFPIEASISQTTLGGSKYFTVVVRDVTERIRAEHLVKNGEQRNRDLVLFSPVAMIVTRGPLYENELVNLKFTELFGYTIQDLPDEAHWWPLAYPDEAYRETVRAKWQENVQKAASRHQKQIEPMDAIVQCKDGSKRHIQFHFSSFGETNLVSFVDLTERERIQTKLRESEGRFREIADAAPVLIWMSETDKLCTYFNKPWLKFTGRSIEQELGNGWAEGVHPEDLPQCLDTYTRSFDQREKFRMEYRLRRHDGEYRWMLDIGVPRFNQDNSFAGYIGICVDVTERRRAEEARLRYAAIVESSDDAIIGTDVTGTVTDWNKGAEQLFGYVASEAIGKSISFLSAEDYREDGQRILKKVLNGESVKHHEAVRQKKDGARIDIALTVSPMVDSAGRIVGVAGIARDISEQKHAADAVKRSEEKFSKVFRQNPTALTLTRAKDHCYLDVNEAFERTTGWHRDEIVGRTPFDLGVWVDPGQRLNLATDLLAGRMFRDQEVRYRLKNGTERVASGSAELVEIGNERCILSALVDITEQKHAEHERRLSENRFRQFFETMPEYGYVVSPKGEILEANLAACVALGYTKDEMVGKPISSIYAPECHSKLRELFTKWKTDGKLRNEEMVVITKRAQRRTVLLNVGSVKDSDGNILHSTSVQIDITERKIAEEKLRESEQQFRTLAEAIPQLCWIAQGDGHIFWYNQRWYTYTGTTPEKMEGWGWQSVHDPRTLPNVLERWKTSISTGEPFDMVFPLRGADGIFRPFITRVMPIKDTEGRVVRWFGTNTDITELREAQEALRASEERLRMGQWAAHIGTYEWNLRTGVSIWTPELEALYGLQPGAFGGTREAFESLVHPDDRARVVDLIEQAMKTGQPTEGEWRVIWHDGSLHWIRARGRVFIDDSGGPSRMFGVHLDVTERKLAEEALSGMSRKLIDAQEKERTRIARELHDDINQRLALLAVELDRSNQMQPPSSELRELIVHAQGRIHEIAKDIQSLSHQLHSSKLEYLGLATAANSFCRELSERSGVSIKFSHAGIPRMLPKEVSLCLFRVMQEALHNAVKHSGVKDFVVALNGKSDAIELTVTDSGRGFEEQEALTRQGIGLISMRERLQFVHGELSIRSHPNAGTTIQARIPLGSSTSQTLAG